MAAPMNLIINEVLCYLFGKFGKATIKQLQLVLLHFYTVDELVDAKELLHNECVKLCSDKLPRLVKRKQGDNRAKLVIDDIMELITIVDEQLLLDKLPTFVAQKLERISTVAIEEFHSCPKATVDGKSFACCGAFS